MRQFDSINDEIEVGYDQVFEHRWRHVALVGRTVMLLVVVAALLGLLGQGPFSHHTVTSASSRLSVDLEPVARFGNATQITLHARPVSCSQGMTIWLGSKFIEPMGLQSVLPRPLFTTPMADGMLMHFGLSHENCQNAVVRVFAKPTEIGYLPLKARLDQDAVLPWHVFIVP